MEGTEGKKKKTDELAGRLIGFAMDTIIVNMRFMDTAIAAMPPEKRDGSGGLSSDGSSFYYDPVYVLKKYAVETGYIARAYIHTLLHFVFNHGFGSDKLEAGLWDLSCDIAVENIIMELGQTAFALPDDDRRRIRLKGLKAGASRMSAEGIYRYFLLNPPAESSLPELKELFFRDDHSSWRAAEKLEVTEQEWKKINERIKAELRSFSKALNRSETLIKNLEEGTREKYDYRRLLERFCSMGEELSVSDDEFDYIYYTYGLTHYDDMPFIEPLEFRDVKKIKEFVIVLDTSASCRGDIVRSFLTQTYDIISEEASFFQKVNIHIIQCDNEVQSDTRIENRSDFQEFIKTGRLTGFGGTDFRPAFQYVEELMEKGEFVNLKGLIYFTDGYGIYPATAPEYDCIFAFLSRDEYKPQVPWWVIPVVLDEETTRYGGL